jgi:hypothetical protein
MRSSAGLDCPVKRAALNELERLVRWIRHRDVVAHNFVTPPLFVVCVQAAQAAKGPNETALTLPAINAY